MTKLINEVDFTKPHDPDDYLHYVNRIYVEGEPREWVYSSFEKSSRSVVYRGPMSYWERRNKDAFEMNKLKKRSNYKSIINEDLFQKQQEEELEAGVLRKEVKKEPE